MNSHNAIRTGNFYVVIETLNSYPEHYAKIIYRHQLLNVTRTFTTKYARANAKKDKQLKQHVTDFIKDKEALVLPMGYTGRRLIICKVSLVLSQHLKCLNLNINDEYVGHKHLAGTLQAKDYADVLELLTMKNEPVYALHYITFDSKKDTIQHHLRTNFE